MKAMTVKKILTSPVAGGEFDTIGENPSSRIFVTFQLHYVVIVFIELQNLHSKENDWTISIILFTKKTTQFIFSSVASYKYAIIIVINRIRLFIYFCN